MERNILCICLLVISGICISCGFQTSDFILCYNCRNISDTSKCNDMFICNQGEICHSIKIADDSRTYYNLGCESKQICDRLPSLIFGKRDESSDIIIPRGQRPECAMCCDNPLCNRALCTMAANVTTTTTAATTDTTSHSSTNICQDKPECSYLLKHFPVCNDDDTAVNLCPVSCSRCPTTTPMTTKPCVDQSPTCGYLQDHLNICSDPAALVQFGCFKTCNKCGLNTQTTTIANSVSTSASGLNTQTTSTANSVSTSTPSTLTQHICSKGNNFHLMFLSNAHTVSDDVQLLIASPQTSQVRVINQLLNITRNILNSAQITIVGGIQQTPQHIENKGITVHASNEISVYAFNSDDYSSDGFLALADECLGAEYVVSTYINPSAHQGDSLVFISVMAMESTTVTFDLHMQTANAHTDYNGNIYRNGDVLSVNLAENKTFELKSEFDLTGTRVHSTKTIAFSAGSDCSVIGSGSCSHVESMYPPIGNLAEVYIIPTLRSRTASIVRVVSTSNTKTVVNATLRGSSETKEISPKGHIDFHLNAGNPMHLSCNDKVSVTQYAEGNKDFTGDPFSMFIPGHLQYLSEYHFVTPAIGFANYMTVIIKKSEAAGLVLDGHRFSAISSSDIQEGGGNTYSVFRTDIKSGYHHMEHDAGEPFGVFVYGNGPSDGYGYPAGFSVRN